LFTRQSSEDELNVLSKENNSISRGKTRAHNCECLRGIGIGMECVGGDRVTQIHSKRKWRISNKNAKIKLEAAIKVQLVH